MVVERAATNRESAPSFIISFSQTTCSGNLCGLGPTAFPAQPVLIREGPLGLHQCLLMEGPCASLLSSHFETQTWPSFANEKGGSLGGAQVMNYNEVVGYDSRTGALEEAELSLNPGFIILHCVLLSSLSLQFPNCEIRLLKITMQMSLRGVTKLAT